MEGIQICECHALPIMILSYFLSMISIYLIESAMEKQWRRKELKFLSNEDIKILNNYLKEDAPIFDIGIIIKNAHIKEKELRKIKKEWWKKLWKK